MVVYKNMNLQDYLLEVKIGDNPELEKVFNEALKEVFSPNYLNKIENELKKKIKLKEKIPQNSDIVAWNKGTNIYVNPKEFFNKKIGEQKKYLLHEFIHVLLHSRSLLFFNKFKEIKTLSKKLYKIARKESKNVGRFLSSRDIPQRFLNSEEAVAYLMNNAINWNEISASGKQRFVSEIVNSAIFNTASNFWKRRIK